MNGISVCTIYAKRKLHLQNLVRGLLFSKLSPDELVIVCMNDRLPKLPKTSFKIKTATISTDDNLLPLAAARNKAAAIATGEKLIFLDVDCICDRDLVSIFNYHLIRENALYQGAVRYLRSGWQKNNWTQETLQQQSSPNKLQGVEVIGKNQASHSYELFWSLCFGVRKKTFYKIGGFDENYVGYGGEDTDFSLTARSHFLPLYKISALAYHQFHPACDPPLNHLVAIVNNANVFYDKWNMLPMEKWLDRFADMGYVSSNGDRIKLIKYPTDIEVKACQKNY